MTRTKHKILSVFLSFCMIISCMVGMSATVYAAGASYVDGSGESKTVDATELEAATTNWTDGSWYIVPASGLTISGRIKVNGTVNLILRDGATLTASAGITTTGATLNIYAQSAGTGALTAKGSKANLFYLWTAYKKEYPDGYQYTQFVEYFKRFAEKHYGLRKVSMAVERVPGQRVYIDWVGDEPEIIENPEDGTMQKAHVFVTTVGVSDYVYAEIFPDEKMTNFVAGTVHALEYYGAIPRYLVPDNASTAVTKHTKDQLMINSTYQDLRDKRKHEVGSTAANPTYDKRMPNIPYFLANFGIELHKENLFGGKEQNSRFLFDSSYIHEYFYDFEMSKYQDRKIPTSLTFDTGIEHSFGNNRWTLSFKLKNLTDRVVYSDLNRPLPGRNIAFKVKYIMK